MDLFEIERKNQMGIGDEVKWVVREGTQSGTDKNNGLLKCCMESLIQQKLLKYIPM